MEDVYKTFIEMRPSIYVLGYLAGIQALSFAGYLAYKYIQDNKTKDENTEESTEKVKEVEPELQMEPIEQITDNTSSHTEKELYSLLTTKRDELESLINQLNFIQTNIMTIRDKLEELNKSNEQ